MEPFCDDRWPVDTGCRRYSTFVAHRRSTGDRPVPGGGLVYAVLRPSSGDRRFVVAIRAVHTFS
ncbi:hypothetical protein B1756_08555 [Natrarchaeobaculum aegyptiacum]|uniref:Uncharacterized protein n=1 Tax=Natrarchaeobaculum aegyptiacum TaxID=745377 RepID=A0A2Z2HXS8_9EURY|nr:hypothetical protein B1756_08555 [Natrarchaeobaculum aegyptiacum]